MSELQQLMMLDLEEDHASLNKPQIISRLQTLAAYKERVFYPPKEVAELLGLSYFQIFSAIRMYRLDAVRIGYMWRVPWTAIVRFLEEEEYRKDVTQCYYDWVRSRGGA